MQKEGKTRTDLQEIIFNLKQQNFYSLKKKPFFAKKKSNRLKNMTKLKKNRIVNSYHHSPPTAGAGSSAGSWRREASGASLHSSSAPPPEFSATPLVSSGTPPLSSGTRHLSSDAALLLLAWTSPAFVQLQPANLRHWHATLPSFWIPTESRRIRTGLHFSKNLEQTRLEINTAVI